MPEPSEVKLFHVERYSEPDYGRAYNKSSKYFSAKDINRIISEYPNMLQKDKGDNYVMLTKYYRFDESTDVVYIREVEVTHLESKYD